MNDDNKHKYISFEIFFTFIYLFWGWSHICRGPHCVGQKTTHGSLFCPLTMPVFSIVPSQQGLAANICIC